MKEKGKQNKGRKREEQRKKNKIAEPDGVEQDGKRASEKRTRRANPIKKNNQIQSLTVKVVKLTNHNQQLSRKLKKKISHPLPQYRQVLLKPQKKKKKQLYVTVTGLEPTTT